MQAHSAPTPICSQNRSQNRIRHAAKAFTFTQTIALVLCYCLVVQPNAALSNSLNRLTPVAATPSASQGVLDSVLSFFGWGGAQPVVVAPVDAAISRKVPSLSNGRIEGNLRVYTGQTFSFDGGFVVTNETYVVGTPNVTVATNANWNGMVDEGGSADPVGYQVNINGTSRLIGKIHRRTDALGFPSDIPTSVPQPSGTRIVNINTSADLATIGDWSTLKELHVNKSGETITVPAGNYGSFSVTGNSRLNFSGVYNFSDGFSFASNASVKATGQTTINVGSSATISNTGVLIGENTLPGDIKINVLGPSLLISGNASIKALVRVPNGTASVTGASLVRGQVVADKVEILTNANVVGDLSSNAAGDTTPPTVTITSPANNATINNSSVTVTGTAIDPGVGASGVASVLVNNIPAIYDPNTNTWTVNLGLNFGANTITVVATDGAGNTSPNQQIAVSRPQDTTPPTVAITSPANNSPTEASSITVSGTVSDTGANASGVAQVTVNGSPATLNLQAGTWTIANVSLPNIGPNEINAVATDVAGNVSQPSTITVNRQDTGAPTISITEPSDGSTTPNASVTVKGNATDDGANATGVSRVVVNGQQANYNSQTHEWTIDLPLSEGSNPISAHAEDNASPVNRSATVTINVNRHTPDTTSPTVTITTPLTAYTTYDATASLAGTAVDNGLNATGVQSVKVNGTPANYNPATHLWSLPSFDLGFGENHIIVTATDGATPANQGVADVRITRLHLQPPTLTITNPTNVDAVSSSSITVAGIVASDLPTGLTVTVKGVNTPITGGRFARTVQLNEGSNAIPVVAKDAQGQETQASITIIRDTTAPLISFVNVPASVQPGGTYQLQVDASDNIAIADVEFRLNGQHIATATTAPYLFTLQVPAGASGVTLVLSAIARDLTNTTTVATAQTRTGGPGGISGYVFDDTTGYVLSGVNALLNSEGSVLTDGQGVFNLISSVPSGVVRLTKADHTPVERLYTVSIGEGTALFDGRLSPLDSHANLIGAGGGAANGDDGRLQATFVAGTFADTTDVRVTSVSPQGLENLLPFGWSPVPGAVVDVRTASGDGAMQAPIHLTISHVSGLSSTTPLTLARYDSTSHRWMVVAVGLFAGANGALSADVSRMGQYAFLVADTGANAPPQPTLGQALTTAAPADSAALDSTQATAVAAPRSAVFAPGAKSAISFFATAPTQLPSGLFIEATFGETYNLLGGRDSVLVDRPAQDFVLYAYPATTTAEPNRLGAFFVAKPTRSDFNLTELFNANVHIEIRSGRQTKVGVLIDGNGGSVRAGNGSQLTIPATAVSGSQSVFFNDLTPELANVTLPEGYEIVGAFDVDLGSATLNSSATISLPGITGDLSRILVARLLTVGGQRSPKVVARAVADSSGKVSSTTASPDVPAGVSLSGIRSSGRYLFIRAAQPFGYVKGQVTDSSNNSVATVRVSNDKTPFIDVTAADGQFVVVGSTGTDAASVNQIGAAALLTDATGKASATLTAQDTVATVNISVATVPLQVESISPAANAQNMIATTPVTVTFNKPVAPSSITGSSFALSTTNGNPVLGNITVLAGNRVVVFTPAATLAASTSYRVSLNQSIRDIYGQPLAAAFTSTFTTAATVTINNRLRPEQIVIGYPDANSVSNITIPAQSVPDGSSLLIVNTTSGSTLSTVAGTGAITLQIQARVGDEITLTITQPDGTQYGVTQAAYRRADGFISVGSNGGTITSDDGQVLLSVPAGAISGQADLKLSRRSESDISIPRQGEMDPASVPFGAGLRINVSGNFTNNKELHLEVAAPANAVEGRRVAFMTPAKFTDASGERDVWEVVTSGKVEGGKFKTMSPPFFGVTIASNLQFIDVYVFTPHTFRAVTGIITEKVNNAAPKPLANVVVQITAGGSGPQPSVICRTAANGRFGTLDYKVASASSVDVLATDTLGRTETAGATPYLNIDPIQNPGLNGLISMFVAIEFPSSQGLPETLPALLQMEGRMLDLDQGEPDTLREVGRVRVGSHLEITTKATPDVKQISADLLAGGTVVRQLVWSNPNPGSGVYVTDFTVDAENSYSVAVTTHTQANVALTKATASFNFVALQDPNTRPSLEGPPRVLSVTPGDKAQQVNTGTRIHLEFSEPVKNLVAGQTIYLTDLATGAHIGGELTSGGLPIGPSQQNISSIDLQPTTSLEANKEYAVEVTTSVKDSQDNALDQEYTSATDNSPQPFRSTFKTFHSFVLTETPPQTDSYRVAVAGDLAITVTPGSSSTMHIWDITNPEKPTFMADRFVPAYATAFDIAELEQNDQITLGRPNVPGFATIAVVASYTPQDTTRPINLWIYSLDDPAKPIFLGVVSLNIPASVPAFPMYVKIHHKRAYIGNTARGGLEVVDLEEAVRKLAKDGPVAWFPAVAPNGGYAQDAKKQRATYGHSNNEAAPVYSVSLMDQNVPAAGGGGALASPVAYIASNKLQLISFDFHESHDNEVVFSDGNNDTYDDRVLAAKDLSPAGFALDVRAIPSVNLLGQATDLSVLLGGERLWIFNVTNPRDPIPYPSRSFADMGLGPDLARRMDVEGTLAYVMFTNKVAVIDFSDPARPFVSSTITDIGDNLRWVSVRDGFVYTLDAVGSTATAKLRTSIGGAAALVYVHGANRSADDVCANPVLISRADNRMLQPAETIFKVYGHDTPQSMKVYIRKETKSNDQTVIEPLATVVATPDPASTNNIVVGRAQWTNTAPINRAALYTAEVVLDEGQPTEFRARRVEIPFSNLIDQYSDNWGIPQNGGIGHLNYLLGGNANITLMLQGADSVFHTIELENGTSRAYGFHSERIMRSASGLNDLPPGTYLFRLIAAADEVAGVSETVEGTVTVGEQARSVRQPGSIVVGNVELESGNLALTHNDVPEIKNRGLSLSFTRFYNSGASSGFNPFGYGWQHNYQVLLVHHSQGDPNNPNSPAGPFYEISGGEGGGQTFLEGDVRPGVEAHARAPFQGILRKNSDDSFDFFTRGHVRYHFNQSIEAGSAALFNLGYMGNLSYVEEPNLNKLTLNYDAQGRLFTVTDSSNRKLEFTYEQALTPFVGTVDSGSVTGQATNCTSRRFLRSLRQRFLQAEIGRAWHIIKVTGPGGLEVNYDYDGNGNLQRVSRSGADQISQGTTDSIWQYDYNPTSGANANPNFNHLIKSVKAPNQPLTESRLTSFQYDLNKPGRPVTSVQMPENVSVGYSYTFTNGKITGANVTDGRGNPTAYQFVNNPAYSPDSPDQLAKTVTTSAPRSAQTIVTFDGFGNRLSETDAEGTTTTSRYERGNLVEQTVSGQGLSIHTSATYDPTFNKRTSMTDANQQTTSYTIDGHGNVTRVQLPTGRSVITDYLANGDVQRVIDQFGFVTTYDNYDAHGNPQTIRRQASSGNFVTTNQTFDVRSRLKTSSGDIAPTLSNTYDGLDHLVQRTLTDPAGFRETLTSTATYLTEGQIKTVTHFGNGQQLSIVNEYDGLNRVILTTETPNGSAPFVRPFKYDRNSNLEEETDRRGVKRIYTYDALNYITSETLSGPHGNSLTTLSAEEIDKVGNPKLVRNLYGQSIRLDYDGLHRLSIRHLPENYTEEFGYDGNGNITLTKDRNGRETRFEFDAANRQKSMRDPAGRITTWTYDDATRSVTIQRAPQGLTELLRSDGLGRVIRHELQFGANNYFTTHVYNGRRQTTTDPRGTVTVRDLSAFDEVGRLTVNGADPAFVQEMHYAPMGGMRSSKDALNRETTYTLDGLGRATQINLPGGFSESFTYDGEGLVLSHNDRRGALTTMTYDNLRRRLTQKVQDGTQQISVLTTQYDDAANREVRTDANGKSTLFLFDGLHRLSSLTNADNKTKSYFYDGVNLQRESDFKGKFSEYEYDALDRVKLIKDRKGQVLNIANSDNNGYTKTTTNRRGYTKVETYDPLGRLTSVVEGGESLVSYKYDGNNNRTLMTDGSDHPTTYDYDKLNRVKTINHADQQTETFSYDAVGNVLTYSDGRGPAMSMEYDELDHLKTRADGEGNVTRLSYDGEGLLLEKTDPKSAGHKTLYNYNALRSLKQITDAKNGAWQFVYDDAQNLRSVRDARTRVVSYDYDAMNRLQKVTQPQNVVTLYGYDANGNRNSITDPKGQVTTIVYDELDRADTLTYANTSGSSPLGFDFEYDTENNLTGVEEKLTPTTTRRYARSYDERNRLQTTTDPFNRTVTYSYFATNKLKTIKDSAGNETRYTYDAVNRLQNVTMPNGSTAGYSWFADGLLKTVDYGAGLKREYTYDNADRLTQVTNTVGTSGVQTQQFVYGYDPNSNRTSETRKVDGHTTRANTYSYDLLDRLTSAGYTTPGQRPANPPAGQSVSYTEAQRSNEFDYDEVGNRNIAKTRDNTTTITLTTDDNGVTSETRQTVNGPLVTATSTFNDLNRLTELSSDASGSVLTTYGYDNNGNLTSTTQNSQVTSQFEYDCRDQLRRVRNGGGQEIAAYDYDFERHRLAKTVGASSLKYVYGGNQVIGEYNSDNQLQNRYDLGADEVVRAELGGEGSRHYFGDGSKSVTALAQQDGATSSSVTATYEYDTWGNYFSTTGASNNVIGYTGQRYDGETGLMPLGNGERYYSPTVGSFIQQDSFAGMAPVAQSMNRYAYGHGNPVINTDPSGHIVGIDDAAAIILIGFLLGVLYGVAKQDAEIRDGTRKQTDFSLSEAVVYQGLPGAVVAPALAFSGGTGLVVGGTLSAVGIAQGVSERMNGQTHAGNIDIVFGVAGLVGTAYGARQSYNQRSGTLLAESKTGLGTELTSFTPPEGPTSSEVYSVRSLAASDRYINDPARLLTAAVEESQTRSTRFIADAEGNIADLTTGRGRLNPIGKQEGIELPASTERGLGDATTSPALQDPRAGIASHLEMFREGGSFLIPESAYENYVAGKPTVGDPAGQYITTKSYMDAILSDAAGDITVVKQRLSIPERAWNEPLRRIDIDNPLLHNARMPSGLERGANEFFRWGGYTKGGMPEVVIDPVPTRGVTVSPPMFRK